MVQPDMAPKWRITEWLNTPEPIDLEAQRGRVAYSGEREHRFWLIVNTWISTHGA